MNQTKIIETKSINLIPEILDKLKRENQFFFKQNKKEETHKHNTRSIIHQEQNKGTQIHLKGCRSVEKLKEKKSNIEVK